MGGSLPFLKVTGLALAVLDNVQVRVTGDGGDVMDAQNGCRHFRAFSVMCLYPMVEPSYERKRGTGRLQMELPT